MAPKRPRGLLGTLKRYVLAGVLTIVPIWITWLVVEFVVRLLARAGRPAAAALADALRPHAGWLSRWLENPWFQGGLAIVLLVAALYVLGWLATKYLGRKLIAVLDALMDRIPMVRSVYGSVKKLLEALQEKPGNVRRVVLIDFPSTEMKTVGMVTRTFTDADTGRELAAVYVPTTPNPTSGYLEIVPVERITSTEWTVDEAMSFIISGGAVAPKRMNYDRSAAPAPQAEDEPAQPPAAQ